MLYPTTNQPLMLLILFVAGIACGVIFDGFAILANLLKQEKAAKHFFDFFACILSFCLLCFLNLKFNYGQFRIYLFLIFIFAICLERVISNLLLSKIFKKIFKKKKL